MARHNNLTVHRSNRTARNLAAMACPDKAYPECLKAYPECLKAYPECLKACNRWARRAATPSVRRSRR